mmetsp:Transcript_5743/g.6386  ORF Transcript_5743/g.6386 Transcript_5743/m.6386 type:complete len:267 (-) Transcript_5743:1196-1996(-)|eukprot:CAMPEP_0114972648 /NCGR_PEP_ID=MMETSP0216-20121206/513_1 /TAXON_ID=223996 /ORGANISM="Protocruzia adherens, Strain Boccale" /LENGTH=266 /DNA_ID=CAMNT_0002333047 /DNA_START=1462 /DNA_END=2262 /DNA_ORIENTATION=+
MQYQCLRTDCTDHFPSIKSLRRHLCDHKIHLTCKLCQARFSTKSEWKLHALDHAQQRNINSSPLFFCRYLICGAYYRNKQSLYRHLEEHRKDCEVKSSMSMECLSDLKLEVAEHRGDQSPSTSTIEPSSEYDSSTNVPESSCSRSVPRQTGTGIKKKIKSVKLKKGGNSNKSKTKKKKKANSASSAQSPKYVLFSVSPLCLDNLLIDYIAAKPYAGFFDLNLLPTPHRLFDTIISSEENDRPSPEETEDRKAIIPVMSTSLPQIKA